ncbi:uncharacterized protein LOC109822395 [Asparagus officinalis]|uniref:uncharacterized protein LOC109822395 n=1 Tax=Asparagus officinalis TaxID=4686 RepID=UPI00098DF0BF|nr:uncharacterized protein LOC109822395 [Asparagus officinalis]
MLPLSIKKSISVLLSENTHLIRFSSAPSPASKALDPSSPTSNLIAQCLINSCGFSSQKASAVVKHIPRSTLVGNARSVMHFFKHHGGLTETHIRKLISNYPSILNADVDKTLNPNLQTLREMGFGEDELPLLLTSNPPVLVNPLAIPRLDFWQSLIGTVSRKELAFIFSRNRGLISQVIDSSIAPKIILLKSHGIPETEIIRIIKRGQGLISRSLGSIEALLRRVQELGFDVKTPMFGQALSALSGVRMDNVEEKMEFFKGFGWSEEEFLSAVTKAPYLLRIAKDNVVEKMEFLVKEAGCEQSCIASNPLLLMFSLEKRLKPRNLVLQILKSNEIVQIRTLSYIMSLSEKTFLQNIVLRHKEQVPKIHEIYLAACAGKLPI